jgi:hypothetical protein
MNRSQVQSTNYTFLTQTTVQYAICEIVVHSDMPLSRYVGSTGIELLHDTAGCWWHWSNFYMYLQNPGRQRPLFLPILYIFPMFPSSNWFVLSLRPCRVGKTKRCRMGHGITVVSCLLQSELSDQRKPSWDNPRLEKELDLMVCTTLVLKSENQTAWFLPTYIHTYPRLEKKPDLSMYNFYSVLSWCSHFRHNHAMQIFGLLFSQNLNRLICMHT